MVGPVSWSKILKEIGTKDLDIVLSEIQYCLADAMLEMDSRPLSGNKIQNLSGGHAKKVRAAAFQAEVVRLSWQRLHSANAVQLTTARMLLAMFNGEILEAPTRGSPVLSST